MTAILFKACFLTVLLETGFFALFGYRSRRAVTVVICANVITNLLLNLGLILLQEPRNILVPVGELLVLAAEYLIYRTAFGPSAKLFVLTAAANALSFTVGWLWQSL